MSGVCIMMEQTQRLMQNKKIILHHNSDRIMSGDLRAHQQWMQQLGEEAARRRYMPNMADMPDDMMPNGMRVSKEEEDSASSSDAGHTVLHGPPLPSPESI